jgi:ankyrin repeat protein
VADCNCYPLSDGPEAEDGYGQSLLKAAGRGHEVTVRLLLDAGTDVEAKDNDGQTPLSKAAGRGHKETVRLLLDWGADVRAEDNDGQTPLLKAIEGGRRYKATEMLLRNVTSNTATWKRKWIACWVIFLVFGILTFSLLSVRREGGIDGTRISGVSSSEGISLIPE